MREVKPDSIEDYAHQNRLSYLETSAANGSNVTEAFNQLIKGKTDNILEIYMKVKVIAPDDTPTPTTDKNEKHKTNIPQPNKNESSTSPSRNENLKLNPNKPPQKEKKKGCC